ncbi:MAG TPA: mersacidin/lichenicidin family type 2 lantibiotic [Ktedonobacteraceae bacterium]|nr:mersacidin/lichenicidin family type 2 lantibiotic [Ktedonobacteraceae bacterium]
MNINIARAWKDAEYRKTLSAEELALLPENPVGAVELSEDETSDILGGNSGGSNTCCQAISVCSVICSVIC